MIEDYPNDKKELLERITKMVYESKGKTDWFYYTDKRMVNMFGSTDASNIPSTVVLQFNGGQFDVNQMQQHIVDLVAECKCLKEQIEVYKGFMEEVKQNISFTSSDK